MYPDIPHVIVTIGRLYPYEAVPLTDEAAFDKHMIYPFLKKHLDVTAPMLDGEVELIGFWDRVAAPNK